jgi:hypothetical protein
MPRLSRWKWGRPEDVDNQNDVPAFIHGGAGASDVEQGEIGDCWFIGALSTLAARDELLIGAAASSGHDSKMLVDGVKSNLFSKGVYPALFH